MIGLPAEPRDWTAFWAKSDQAEERRRQDEEVRARYSNDQLMLPHPDLSWRPFASAPDLHSPIRWFEVLHPVTGEVHRVHFAQDLSGEYQPGFSGYFEEWGSKDNGFIEIDFDPRFWREIASG